MTIFSVGGPHVVKFYEGAGGRSITDDHIVEFWARNHEASAKKGCYVFGIRAGKGWGVGYVGKATKSFKQEVFTDHKVRKYLRFLADYEKGTPVLFFVTHPLKKGATNSTHIGELEDFLIQAGVAANPNLLNIKGTKAEEWGIAGIRRGGKGKPSKAARDFKKLMKIQ